MAEAPLLDSVITPPTLAEVAFKAIKEAILAGRFVPGAIYSEQAVARDLGISKTPVHEALTNLSTKGFVTILPRKGFRVTVLTAKNVKDMFEFRRPMEGVVILNVTSGMTDRSLAEVDRLLSRLTRTRDPVRFQEHDRSFHRYLASLTGNQYIVTALNNIWDLCDWVGARVLATDGRFELAVQEHLAIGEGLKRRDPQLAVKALEDHLRSTEAKFLSLLGDQ